VTWTFGAYDAADRLLTRSSTNEAYTSHPATQSPTYAANGLNQYTSVGGTSFSYDGRGNLTSDGSRTFTYDVENRLLTASAPTAVTLTYDPTGRLQTSTASSATTTFLYDDEALAAEYNSSGTVLRRYVSLPGADKPLVWYEGSGTSTPRWLHADDQGSVMAYSTSTGAEGTIYGYGPYGEPDATNGWSGGRYRYTGQIMIPEAQLYYYKARVYDPKYGRFLQTDPVGYKDDNDLYAYVHNDPIDHADPSGDMSDADWLDLAGDVVQIGSDIAGAGEVVGTEGLAAAGPAEATVAEGNAAGEGLHATAAEMRASRETGSYTNTHESGRTYDGKGSRERSQVSGRRVEKATGDKHVATHWESAKSDREAFKNESKNLQNNGSAKSNNNYNKIDSPGTKYRQKDGDNSPPPPPSLLSPDDEAMAAKMGL